MKVTSLLYEIYLSQQNSQYDIDLKSKTQQPTFTGIADLESKVRKELLLISDKALKLFDEFQEARTLYVCTLEETAYSVGFATGFKLALETAED